MKNSVRTVKTLIANVMVAVVIMLSVIVAPTNTASAASKPELTKKSISILEGKKYNLNVNHKIKGSTYKWSTSSKKIATVTKSGIVKGISKGTATIKCKVTYKADTYNLSCKVTVMKAAYGIQIKNKVSSLTIGQVYDFNRRLSPSTSTEKTTWSSSDKTVAVVDKNGKTTALKEGTVTITAKSTSGYKDSVTITVIMANATASNQKELEALLGTSVGTLTIKTQDLVSLTIPAGDYSNQKLIVEAPNADITNYGKFASIDIKEIKSDTWHEEAVGNLLRILAAKSRVVVGVNAKVNIEVNEQGATMTIVNNGIVEKITIEKPADIAMSGTSEEHIPVVLNVPGITLSSSVPLALDCQEKAEITLFAGAEKSTIQAKSQETIPAVKGTVTVDVKVGTGDKATTVVVTPAPATVTPAPIQGGGSTGGGNGIAPDISTVTNGLKTTYTLSKPISQLSSIEVTYGSLSYTMNDTMLTKLVGFLTNDATTLENWRTTTNKTRTYTSFGITQSVTVTGSVGYTKTVALAAPLSRTYSITVDGASRTVLVTNTAPGGVTYTFWASSDLKTLTIEKSSATGTTATFTPHF